VDKKESFRGFDDEFENYKIGKHTIPIESLSFTETKRIKELSRDYNETLQKFDKGEIDDFERIDKQDEFIEKTLELILTDKQKEELFNDKEVSKPSLFGFVKDYYSFLQIIGSGSEAKHLLMQSDSTTSP
jgi:hypothetical protein